mmetsp:Transcript_20928/g.32637  ORF Transcript_20928/g.32637 Transcript_20928/m.32637 type:complete len:205 (-) Transcript_20928:234-848(-)
MGFQKIFLSATFGTMSGFRGERPFPPPFPFCFPFDGDPSAVGPPAFGCGGGVPLALPFPFPFVGFAGLSGEPGDASTELAFLLLGDSKFAREANASVAATIEIREGFSGLVTVSGLAFLLLGESKVATDASASAATPNRIREGLSGKLRPRLASCAERASLALMLHEKSLNSNVELCLLLTDFHDCSQQSSFSLLAEVKYEAAV